MFYCACLQEARSELMSPKTMTPWLEHYKEFRSVRVLPTEELTPEVMWRAFYAFVDFL